MRLKMLAFLLTTLALCVAVILGAPRTAAACSCGGVGDSNEYTGSGATCAAAASDWHRQAAAEAASNCYPDGVCSSHFYVTVACQFNSSTGLYEESGWEHARCYICF